MTKLIDSLCVDVSHRASKIKDSSESYREIINEAYRDMNGVSYDDAYSIYGWWCPGFDVRALGKQWPNGDPKKSEIFFVPSSNLDVVAVPETVEDHPESMMIIVKSLADSLGVPYVELYPGYYYADSAAKTVDRIGSFEDVKSWVESLESYDDSEGLFDGKDPDKVWDYLKRWDRGSVKDSLQDTKENRSKVLAELNELLKSVSYDKIVEALDYFMSPEEVAKFTKLIREFYGVEPPVSDSYDDEYRQFDRFNDLREEVSDKEIVDVLPSYMGGYEINKFVDKVRNFYGLDQNPNEEIEDSASGKTPSFDDVRRILSDEEVVKELKDWITSEDFSTISSVAGSKDAGSLLNAAKKVLAPDTLESFVREMDESHGISITGGSHFEGEDRLNYLREKAEALKKEVDKLEADPNSDADKLAANKAMYLDAKNLYEKVKKSGSKVSDAAYNPKFEKLRKVLSDTTIVEELSHYMSSDELEEFTETLTRNYDIDLEEVEDSSK